MVENTGKDKVFNWIIYVIMGAYALVTLLPLLFVLANSFSHPDAVSRGLVGLYPVVFNDEGKAVFGFDFQSYQKVLTDEKILLGYRNTLMYTVIGTLIQLFLQFTAAYPLSRRDLKGKKVVNLYFVITMFVSGGMIPLYFVVYMLDMVGSFWAMIIPGCVGVYNIIIIRTYMSSSVPWEFQEAAMIDGCGPIKTFITIVLPLCKPIIAVMTLYAIVGYWNSYYNAQLYLRNNQELWPLQKVLQDMLVKNDMSDVGGGDLSQAELGKLGEVLKYSVIIVSTAPILLIYPFFQKFFEKGLMVGGLKG